jgi:hypothetical protein
VNGRKRRALVLVIVLSVMGLACSALSGSEGGPSVTINRPAEGSALTVGEAVEVASLAQAEAGIAWVELSVDGAVIRRDAPPNGSPDSFSIAQGWMPEQEGQATIAVVACDLEGAFSQMATVTVQVVAAAGAAPTETPQPSATATAEPSGAESPTAESACWADSESVADLTIPDGTEIARGADFVKTWRIRNDGTCDWTSGYQLVFAGGDQMGGRAEVAVPHTRAGTTADLTVCLRAPSAPGVYQGSWRMRSDAGVAFGATLHVRIVVPAPATDTPEPSETPRPTETPPPPAAPTNLTMSTSSSGYLSLVWQDNSGDEDGFNVLADGNILHTLGANASGWGFPYSQYAGVWCGKTVRITVVAYRAGVWSAPSNPVQYTAPPCQPPVVTAAFGVVMDLQTCIDLDTGALGDWTSDMEFLWNSSGGLRIVAYLPAKLANVGLGPCLPTYTECYGVGKGLSFIYAPPLQTGSRLCFETKDGNLTALRVDEIQPDHDLVISYATYEGSKDTATLGPARMGQVDAWGGVDGPPNAGDLGSNQGLQGFVTFDVRGIPDNATILAARLSLVDWQTTGDPFGDLGCLRVYHHNYGMLDADDYTPPPVVDALAAFCSEAELADPQHQAFNSIGIAAVQNRLSGGEFQIRLQFSDNITDGDGADDLLRPGTLRLEVTYEL